MAQSGIKEINEIQLREIYGNVSYLKGKRFSSLNPKIINEESFVSAIC